MPTRYQTPPLPYDYDALEPYIDAETMKLHHDKHHVAYTAKLNAALEAHPELFEKSPEELLMNLEQIPEDIRQTVQNNGGGHVNHEFFWNCMAPHASGEPHGKLLELITSTFGSFNAFKKSFEEAATTQFGSGWAWLTLDNGKLIIEKTANQNTPLSDGRTPLLALDVWEHAYYLRYQNRRPEYVSAFWNIVNWKAIERRIA